MFSAAKKPWRCVIQVGRLKPPAKLIMRIACAGLGCFSGNALGSDGCCAWATVAAAEIRTAAKAPTRRSFVTVDLPRACGLGLLNCAAPILTWLRLAWKAQERYASLNAAFCFSRTGGAQCEDLLN